jgi:hypothetical protein
MSNTSNPDLFEIRPLASYGQASPDAIATGPLSTVMQLLPDTRARTDALEELEAARIKSEQTSIIQDMNKGIYAAVLCDAVTRLTRRIDAEEQYRTEKARRDAEEQEARENRLIEDALSKLPDPDAPGPFAPSADLHEAPASEPAYEEQLQQSGDNEGDLPPELTEVVPPTTGTAPNLSGSREPTAKNPAGLSW